MIRNLKGMLLAALMLTALTAVMASAAQAHTPAWFHSNLTSTTVTTATDTTLGSATSHYVFDIPGGGTATCREVKVHGTLPAKTVETSTVTAEAPLKDSGGAQNCTVFGQSATADTGQCDFIFSAAGGLTIANHAGGNCSLGAGGKPIEVTALGCNLRIGPQALTGITYHNLKFNHETVGSGTGDLVTFSMNVKNIHGEEVGAGCPAPGTFTTGQFTTGNTIVTGANPAKPTEMVSVWWSETKA